MSKGEIIILVIVFFLSMVAWIIGRHHAPSRHSDIWSGENDDLDDVDK